jgi:hypothetical protein
MTSQHDSAKWRQPRFSVRTLVVALTLLCIYLACWRVTILRGQREVVAESNHRFGTAGNEPGSALPFVVWLHHGDSNAPNGNAVLRHFDYYFWFFGYIAKLPYEREIEVLFRAPLRDR